MFRSTPIHAGWEFAERSWVASPPAKLGTSRFEWLPAQVPGHVHLDLMSGGIIEDPFRRMNEIGCQWVDEKDWVYRTRFSFTADPTLPRRVLRFEGLDTLADVYFNGQVVGRSENMFVPFEVDVTEGLTEGENEVRVEFSSAVREGEKLREAYFATEGIKPEILNFSERAFVRKAQYMYGWDWGPRLVSAGIWRPVQLIEFQSRIVDIRVVQDHAEDGSVVIAIDGVIEGTGQLSWYLTDPEGSPVGAALAASGSLRLDEPILWNPQGRGEQALYDLRVLLIDEDTGEELDSKLVRVGIRTAKLLREADQFGESFEFEVNGEKLWVRGANWIPDHSFPSTVSKARYRNQLERAVDMGFNMLRVWGGGLYETDEFYELCDELGILVWQDFPFGCSYYPDDEAFQRVIADEAYHNIRRLRNHPSLVLWCGNNENHQMWHDRWGGADLNPSRYYGLDLYNETLPSVLAREDPNRPYIASSGIGAKNDDADANPNRGGFGDQHNWDVWHGRGDWRYYTESTGRFSSEYGFASSCGLGVWEEALADEDWDPHSPVVRWHDKTGKGHETFHSFVKLHYPESEALEDWVYYSQLNQRDALRHGIEHYRRSEFCKGSLIWQLNDCWPVQSWAILDCNGEYKALGYELRRLYADGLCSLVRENDRIDLWGIHDGSDSMEVQPNLRAYNLRTGELLRESAGEAATLGGGQRRKLHEFSVAGLAVPEVLVTGSCFGGSSEAWMLLAEPKAARFAEPCDLVVSTHSEGELRIRTETPLVDLWLLDNGKVTPFRDNFVTVPQPGVFSVRLNREPGSLQARSLAGEHSIRVTRGPI